MSLEHQLISKDDLLNLNSIENVIALFNKCGFNDFEYLNKPFLGLIFTISEDEQKYIEVHITSKDKIHSYNTRLSPKVRYLFIITDVFQRFMFVTKKIIRVFGKGREKIVRFIFWKNDLKNDEKATIILQRMNALTINNLDTFDNLIHKNISELDAINLLKQCMSIIRNEMDNLDESKETALEEKTGFFYARKMNKDSLINEELIMRFKRDIKSAASYILVDQLFFYHLLQINNPDKFSNPLDEQEGDDPSIFDNFFEDVKKIDYLSVYETNLLEILPKKSSIVVALNQVIRLIVDTAIDELPQDLLGRIFHNMIPLDIRKPLAAFYTSNPSARLLSTLSITKPDMKILDLACGSGTLLV